MASQIPPPIQGQKYISLTTFRKTGVGVATPVWFGEEDGKLYVMTRSDMGKTKRIRNNPQVTGRALHDPGKSNRAGIRRDRPHPAARGTSPRPSDHQPQVLDGADSTDLGTHRYIYRGRLISRDGL